jgi:hypothetical protein
MSPRWSALLLTGSLLACGEAEVGGLGLGGPWAPIFGPTDGGPEEFTDNGFLIPDAGPARDRGVRDRGVPEMGILDAEPPPPRDILQALRGIPGLRVQEVQASLQGTRAFLLRFRQPEDHDDPQGPTFDQRLVLIHRSETAPMVLHTTGYGLFGNPMEFTSSEIEPTVALGANQLTVEHRFFGESIAASPRWDFLTVVQSAADSHRIVTLLSAIYGGPWIGSGYSKGGMTAIFHHHYHPQDLAGIVPYVAPISFGLDTRYAAFLAQIGPSDGACRERIVDLERETVERRAELAEYHLSSDPRANNYSLEALEILSFYPALGWRWGFWQYSASPELCTQLPPRGLGIEDLASIFPFSPEAYFEQGAYDPELNPYYYQVARELGGPSVDFLAELQQALIGVDFDALPPAPLTPNPWGQEPSLDPTTMRNVDQRLRTRAERVLAIYGEWDPWTGGRITLGPNNDTFNLTAPGLTHLAEILYLSPAEQDLALRTLDRWVGRSSLVARDYTRIKAQMAANPGHRRIMELTRHLEQRAQQKWLGLRP